MRATVSEQSGSAHTADTVLAVSTQGPVRVVTMSRPAHRNAVHLQPHCELTEVWGRLPGLQATLERMRARA